MFRIAAFARLGGVSPKVLRDYDRLAIFRPAWVDPDTGYRLYTPAQLPDLRRILALRDLGVNLSEIRAHVRGGTDLRGVLERRRSELEATRRDVDRQLASVGISLAGDADRDAMTDVVVRMLPDELVATLDVSATAGDESRAFYELERAVRDAGVRAHRPPGTVLEHSRAEVYVPVSRASAGLAVRRLPSVRAATVLHRGSYSSFAGTQRALAAWLASARFKPTGGHRVVYLQFGAESELRVPPGYVVREDADLLTELQVPFAAE